jgi:site-specific recombinase XerD
VQVLMGHTSIASTQIYTRVSKKMEQRAFERCHPSTSIRR